MEITKDNTQRSGRKTITLSALAVVLTLGAVTIAEYQSATAAQQKLQDTTDIVTLLTARSMKQSETELSNIARAAIDDINKTERPIDVDVSIDTSGERPLLQVELTTTYKHVILGIFGKSSRRVTTIATTQMVTQEDLANSKKCQNREYSWAHRDICPSRTAG